MIHSTSREAFKELKERTSLNYEITEWLLIIKKEKQSEAMSQIQYILFGNQDLSKSSYYYIFQPRLVCWEKNPTGYYNLCKY